MNVRTKQSLPVCYSFKTIRFILKIICQDNGDEDEGYHSDVITRL